MASRELNRVTEAEGDYNVSLTNWQEMVKARGRALPSNWASLMSEVYHLQQKLSGAMMNVEYGREGQLGCACRGKRR